GVPDQQPAAHVALGIGEPMRGTVRAEPACFCQGPGITPVGLHLASPRRVHRREVRVRDNHLVAKRLETAGDPFAIGRGLDQDPARGRAPSTAAKRSGSERMRCSRIVPPSPRMQIWLSLLCTSMPIWSMAGLSLLRRGPRGALVGPCMPPRQARGQPLHPIYPLGFSEGWTTGRRQCGTLLIVVVNGPQSLGEGRTWRSRG